MCSSCLFMKQQALRPVALFKRDSVAAVFCEYCEIFKSTFFTEEPEWLLQANVDRTFDCNKLRQITFIYKKKIELISYSQINSKSK